MPKSFTNKQKFFGVGLGLIVLLLGAAVYAVSFRMGTVRLLLVSLPILLVGVGWSINGRPAARALAFPAFLLLFLIPIPGMYAIGNQLRAVQTTATNSFLELLGVDVVAQGTGIASGRLDWMYDFSTW